MFMRPTYRVHVEPFATWLTVRSKRYGTVDAFSVAYDLDSTWVGKVMHHQYRTLDVDTIDRILCAEGGTHLRELYPDLYSD
jgi:hypothetical protein